MMFKVTFKVQGTGQFPVDMLRYDKCHPNYDRDVDGIILTRHNCDDSEDMRTPRKVELATYINTTQKHLNGLIERGLVPTKGRWRSFGWEVIRSSATQIPSL